MCSQSAQPAPAGRGTIPCRNCMKVIGTAGHIDHGKSTLVQRLTGIDPDRLDEEKRRGMTIELGFAWLTLPSGVEASIVDVPGHERFVKNMLAGAPGIDVALLVVAADEGVMPQTREHLDILDLLEVKYGVVALTKSDLVESDWLELMNDEVASALQGTSLAESVIVPVSSTSGEGIPALLTALDAALAAGPPPRDRGRPFLPVDRVFSVSGFGTVVTGTLHDGPLHEGADVEVSPRRGRSRIRSLQTHETHVPSVDPGARVAVNLQGISTADVARGDVVATKGAVVPTSRLDARVRVLPSSPFPLRHGVQASAHIGAAERTATVSILGGSQIEPGDAGWAQLRFAEPIAATRDQRLIIRLPSPARTIAGGTVADVSPRHRRSDPHAVEILTNLLSSNPEAAVLAALEGDRPRSAGEIAFRSGLAAQPAGESLRLLLQSGSARIVGDRYMTTALWERLGAAVLTTLTDYHTMNPLRRGMSKEELRGRVGWRFPFWTEAVATLVGEGLVRDHGAFVSLPQHGGGISSRRTDADAVLQRLKVQPYAPPSGSQLTEVTGADDSLLAAMVAEGEIVKVDTGVYFERQVYDEMVHRIMAAIARDGAVSVATVRDLFGTTRKYALSLLEHLDDERITRRSGDARVLGSKAP
jgi:selenocysteine-specific elongation factor